MTSGAMLLGWLEPSMQSTPADRSTAFQVRLFAEVRRSIDAVLADRKEHWSAVEINTVEANDARRMMLAASREQSPFDFVIGSDGALQWSNARLPHEGSKTADGSALRIALHAGDHESPIADSQWMTLRLLLAELSARRPDAEHALTVRVQNASPHSNPIDQSQLQSVEQLLLRTGMAG